MRVLLRPATGLTGMSVRKMQADFSWRLKFMWSFWQNKILQYVSLQLGNHS